VPGDPLSRRGLFSLDWARAAAPAGPDRAAYREAQLGRWASGAPALLEALSPLVPVLCDVAGAGEDQELLDAVAGDGSLSAEAAARGAVVTACDPAAELVARGRERTEDAGLDVLWEVAEPDALPFGDGSFDAVAGLIGVALAPRARRTVRELLRVLVPGGLLALAVPAPGSLLADALALARRRPEGVPAPADWGREEIAAARIDAVAPGTEVDTRELPFSLEFASEAQAWAACSLALGLPARARDPFANLVSTRSESLASVRIAERATLILARRHA
jgi:SAM-dependent methyltransferase